MTEAKKAQKGSKVKVEYTGSFDDGTVFDSSKGREPISFTLGNNEVINGFDQAITGMKQGEEKKITITPENGYGQRDEKLRQEVPRSVFPPEMKLDKGMGFSFKTPSGQMMHATIAESSGDKVTLDMNHPLAGKNLIFELKLLDVN